ncbi:MAG: adenosine-specific kinase [Candidatus Aenigmatarchaeota archaeon]
MIETKAVKIDVPKDCNVIIGTTHFIKSVEDLHEALVTAVPNIKFGLAFCEASGPCLVRKTGTDTKLTELAAKEALKLSTGHAFIIFLAPGFYPINVMDEFKAVPEVCTIHCATANPVEVIVAETSQGRGILGVIDGSKSSGIETEKDVKERKEFLRKIGYKL